MDNVYWKQWQERLESYAEEYQKWLRAEFYRRVMDYLTDKQPDELLRDDYNANIENIYNKIKEEEPRFMWTLDELNKDREMQDILELLNNMVDERKWYELQTACKEFVAKTDKLVREYEREWIELELDWQYDKLSQTDWFNEKEFDKFYEHFVEPFYAEHPEYSEDDYDTDEKVCSVLRDEMYNQDKYECIVL